MDASLFQLLEISCSYLIDFFWFQNEVLDGHF